MENGKLKSYLEVFIYLIILLFISRFFQFELFNTYPFIQKIYAILSRISFILIVIYWVKTKIFKEKLNVKILVLILGYFFILFILTIINKGNIRNVISECYPIIGTIMFVQIGIKKDAIFLKIFSYYFYIFILINFLDMIFFKDLQKDVYFFIGGRNQLAISLASGFCFVKIYYQKYKTFNLKIFFYSYYFFMLFIAINCKSATCAISIITLVILNHFKILKKIITPASFFISYVFLWCGIVFFQIQNYFKFFIENIFHKDITLTARTDIWKEALKQIQNSLILGHGLYQNDNYFPVIRRYDKVIQYFSGHNQIIQQLYEGGIVSIIFFSLIYFYCLSNKKRDENFYYFFNTIVVISVTWLTENPGIYAMLVILVSFYSFYHSESKFKE